MFKVGDKVRRVSGGGVISHEGIVTKEHPSADNGRGGIEISPSMPCHREDSILFSRFFELVNKAPPEKTDKELADEYRASVGRCREIRAELSERGYKLEARTPNGGSNTVGADRTEPLEDFFFRKSVIPTPIVTEV